MGKIDTDKKHIHDCSLSRSGTSTSVSWWVQSEWELLRWSNRRYSFWNENL